LKGVASDRPGPGPNTTMQTPLLGRHTLDFWVLAPTPQRVSTRTFQNRKVQNASDRVLCRRPFFQQWGLIDFEQSLFGFWGVGSDPPTGQHQGLAESTGLECFRKGSVSEPFFTHGALSILNKACLEFGVLVPTPQRVGSRTFWSRKVFGAADKVLCQSYFSPMGPYRI
jgi:hypothetical protein